MNRSLKTAWMEPYVKEDPSTAAAKKNGEADDEDDDEEEEECCEEEDEGERATSASAAAAMARLELEADSMSSGIVFNYDETDNSEMRGEQWHMTKSEFGVFVHSINSRNFCSLCLKQIPLVRESFMDVH